MTLSRAKRNETSRTGPVNDTMIPELVLFSRTVNVLNFRTLVGYKKV